MTKGILRRNGLLLLGLIAALAALRVQAGEVDVGIRFLNGLSQDPVNIVVGEVVFWFDADGQGPYTIHSKTGAWNDFNTDNGILFNRTGTFPYDDGIGDDGTVIVTLNIPPSVTITNPANNAVLSAPATFDFAVNAADTDPDGLSDVEFYIGTNLVDDVFSDPFTTTITNLPAGSYILTVIAYDIGGATATNSISITVASSSVVPPALIAAQVGNQLVITWSTNNATGLSLQSAPSLDSNVVWTGVATSPVLIGSQLVVTNTMAGRQQFFRLSNH